MATYSKSAQGVEKHAVRAIKTENGLERIASLWVKTVAGLEKIYEAVRSCFGSGRWLNRKPWLNKEKWKNFK